LGDDLALNAQQVSGVRAERELPVVWAVAVGSLKNKLILVPAALAISRFIPWAVTPLLMLGGLYLCLEGVEKLAHRWLHKAGDDDRHAEQLAAALADKKVGPTKRSTWQHSRPTRSRAPSGPTLFSRPKLSSSPSAPSPTSLSPPRSRCCRGSA